MGSGTGSGAASLFQAPISRSYSIQRRDQYVLQKDRTCCSQVVFGLIPQAGLTWASGIGAATAKVAMATNPTRVAAENFIS